MSEKKLFLKWWLFFVLVIVASIISFDLGVFHDIYLKDGSYLSWVIFIIFYYMTVWCGIKNWNLSRLEKENLSNNSVFQKINLQQEIGWFASEICLALGMTGTVFGFILMLKTFLNVDTSNIQSMQNMVVEMGKGMATALYTTLVGLVCSILLKIQYFAVSQAIDTIKLSEDSKNV